MINKHAYLYGGEDDKGKLVGSEVHIVTLPLPINKGRVDNGEADYKCVPPLGEELEKDKIGEKDQDGEDEIGPGQVEGRDFEGEVPACRKWHTAVSVGRRMYIYGGKDEKGYTIREKIRGRVWVFDSETLRWSAVDPVEDEEQMVPEWRWGHGCASSEQPSPKTDTEAQGLGEKISKEMAGVAGKIASLVKGKSDEKMIQPHGTLIICGGVNADNERLKDTWCFDIAERRWARLPDPPPSGGPDLAIGRLAVSGGRVFLVAHPDPTGGGEVHSLQLNLPIHQQHGSIKTDDGSNRPVTAEGQQDPNKTSILRVAATPEQRISQQMKTQASKDLPPTWQSHTFPANPLTPGPLPRQGAAFLPIRYGNGRQYLLYAFGAHVLNPSKSPPPGAAGQYHSTIYAYQPSSAAISAAGVKDATRSTMGADSGEGSWAEVVVQANEEVGGDGEGGKAHPGPRGWFASAAIEGADGVGAVIWGGKNGKGGVEGDGWIISIEGA